MMFKGIDHIAIAVENLDASIQLYEKTFQLTVLHREYIERDGIEIATIDVGGTCIELVEGKRADSPIRKYVEKRGPGIHHIAFEVENIVAALEKLQKDSIQLIDRQPRPGKEGSMVAFINPGSTQKILYELVQKKP